MGPAMNFIADSLVIGSREPTSIRVDYHPRSSKAGHDAMVSLHWCVLSPRRVHGRALLSVIA